MIQRIQSLYLTFIIVLTLMLFNGGILNFAGESGTTVTLSSAGILSDQNQKIIAQVAAAWPLTSVLVLIILISLIDVLMFRNRKIQLLLTMSIIILSAVLIAAVSWFGIKTVHYFKMNFSPGIKTALPVVILILAILALRGIQKDDRLVKSYDRLR